MIKIGDIIRFTDDNETMHLVVISAPRAWAKRIGEGYIAIDTYCLWHDTAKCPSFKNWTNLSYRSFRMCPHEYELVATVDGREL